MNGHPRSRVMSLPLMAALLTAGCVPVMAQSSWLGTLFSGAESHAATAKTVDGDVSVVRDYRNWALEVGSTVKVQETIVTGKDGHALFTVSDGSTFEVFPKSRVVFRKNAGDWRDLLDVMLGRVRVQIEHLGKQPNPNRIMTPTAVISVRGTVFDIVVEDETESTLVTVEDGIVDVRHALLGSEIRRTLKAGESLRVYRDEPIARRWDKGRVFKEGLRLAMEGLAVASRGGATPSLGGIGGGGIGGSIGGVGGVGDTGGGPLPEPTSTPTTTPAGPTGPVGPVTTVPTGPLPAPTGGLGSPLGAPKFP